MIALTQTQSDLWRQKKKEIVLGCHHACSTTVLFKVAFQIGKVGRRSACQQLVASRVPLRFNVPKFRTGIEMYLCIETLTLD